MSACQTATFLDARQGWTWRCSVCVTQETGFESWAAADQGQRRHRSARYEAAFDTAMNDPEVQEQLRQVRARRQEKEAATPKPVQAADDGMSADHCRHCGLLICSFSPCCEAWEQDQQAADGGPTPRYAVIHVRSGDGEAWPIVERVPGGWQSGAHYYPDADVLDVRPLFDDQRAELERLREQQGDDRATIELQERQIAGLRSSAETADWRLAREREKAAARDEAAQAVVRAWLREIDEGSLSEEFVTTMNALARAHEEASR